MGSLLHFPPKQVALSVVLKMHEALHGPETVVCSQHIEFFSQAVRLGEPKGHSPPVVEAFSHLALRAPSNTQVVWHWTDSVTLSTLRSQHSWFASNANRLQVAAVSVGKHLGHAAFGFAAVGVW